MPIVLLVFLACKAVLRLSLLVINSIKHVWHWLHTQSKSTPMVKIIIPIIILIPLTWLSEYNIIWTNTTTHSLLIRITWLLLLNQFNDNNLNFSLAFFLWLLVNPTVDFKYIITIPMLMASQHRLLKESLNPPQIVYYYISYVLRSWLSQ